VTDVDCMTCLTSLATGLNDSGERLTDEGQITHAIFTVHADKGLLACWMKRAGGGWGGSPRDGRRNLLVLRGGVWS